MQTDHLQGEQLRISEGARSSRRKSRRVEAASSATGASGAAYPVGEGERTASSVQPQEEETRRGKAAPSTTNTGDVKDAKNWWGNWQTGAAEMRAKVAKLGLSAVLAYGLFDGVTYTAFFVLAFLGYEKSTGLNPAANLKSLLGIIVTMWAGNNVTRPFRVAGAAAVAPFIDRGLKIVQRSLRLPNLAFAFMLVVAMFASLCFSIVGLLVVSRLGK